VGWLHQLTDALHLLAGGFWIGALVLLALLLRTPPPRELLLRLSSRFSALGVFAVVLVVATGALNALFIVPDWGHFLGSAYGRTLVGKIMPVAAMILLAVVNRSLLTPRIRTGEQAVADLRRNVAIETAVGALVILAASVLGTLPPPS